MDYYIVTGTTSGIGEAIARRLLLDNRHVCCISRRLNESLSEIAAATSGRMWHLEADLGKPEGIRHAVSQALAYIGSQQLSSLTLVNNAAVLDPVMPAGSYDLERLSNHLNVNLLAPMMLTSEFIRLSGQYDVRRTVVNIGSGASSSPYAGWGPYCSSKAALEMFTRTTNLEQKQLANPVRVLCIAPGIVDTPMQATIRSVPAEHFPMKGKFERLYLDNQLSNPVFVAEKIAALMTGSISSGDEIIDLRNL